MDNSPQFLVVSDQPQDARPKVWQMNDYECFAAVTAEEALKAMAEMYCFAETPEGIATMREEYGVDDGYPAALSEETLLERKVNIGDPDENETHLVSFREHLDQLVADGDVPCFFSTTEY